MLEDSMQRKSVRRRMVNASYSQSQMEQSKLSGRDQVVQKSTLIRDQPERGQGLRDGLRGQADGSQPIDTVTDDRDARNDFLSIEGNCTYRHHVEPRIQLYVPKEESFPIPRRYSDVIRRTILDFLLGSRIDDYWNGTMDGFHAITI